VALSDDDDGEAGEALLALVGWVGLFAGSLKEGQFLVDGFVVLALRDAVAVDDDILGEVSVQIAPVQEAADEECLQGRDHFLAGTLDADLGGPLGEG
jgi:hypothetical protein